jgi:predicted MFS family arabinose efflux permease
MIAAPLGTVIYSALGPRALVCLIAVLPACIVPLVLVLGETKDAPVSPAGDQCREIWNTVCSRAVWQPMAFVYLYNVLQVGNVAWKQFLKTLLAFTSDQLNSLLIAVAG